MRHCLPFRLVFLLTIFIVFGVFVLDAQPEGNVLSQPPVDPSAIVSGSDKDLGLFSIDQKEKNIIGFNESVAKSHTFKFLSVACDQPTYWPDEKVYLKIIAPVWAGKNVKLTLNKKNAAPRDLGATSLDQGGMLVKTILDGAERTLEIGEYQLQVKAVDGSWEEQATFSVIEGKLGAVSFAHEFLQLTSPKALEEVAGGWFLGNATGIGQRWGNGLNVKNEIRVQNQPYSGSVKLVSRCLLPGCNGTEAGPSQEIHLEKGILMAVLNVGGHSGPFELEVVTPEGSVKKTFSRSGHIERQTFPLTANMETSFEATLAPYEGAREIPGRDIFVIKKPRTQANAAFSIESPVAGANGELSVTVKKTLKGLQGFVLYPGLNGQNVIEKLNIDASAEPGTVLKAMVRSPWSFIAFAGFTEKGILQQGWVLGFTPSAIQAEVKAPATGNPNGTVTIEVSTRNKNTSEAMVCQGILEVFDNRVADPSSKDPLVSCIGDTLRNLSGRYTLPSYNEDLGIQEEFDSKSMNSGSGPGKSALLDSQAMPATSRASPMKMKEMSSFSPRGSAQSGMAGNEMPIPPRIDFREGEKKVVYCGVIATKADGTCSVEVKLPPQLGRVSVRFVAVKGFEYRETTKDIDIGKSGGVEVSMPALLTPDSKITIKASVNIESEGTLKVSGAGVKAEVLTGVSKDKRMVEFDLTGPASGAVELVLSDSSGTALDARRMFVRDASVFQLSLLNFRLTDGKPMAIPAGRRIAIFGSVGLALTDMVRGIETTMYSWFNHAESIACAVSIRAQLLRAIEEGIMSDGGRRATLEGDLRKGIQELSKSLYDRSAKLIRPFPGLAGNTQWSVWVARDLSTAISTLSGNPTLKTSFKSEINDAANILEGLMESLQKAKMTPEEGGISKFWTGDTVPVEVDGKIVALAVTDPAVTKWFNEVMRPKLKLTPFSELRIVLTDLQAELDKSRLLKAFSRVGALSYLLLNAKAMYLRKDPEFPKVFNIIAKGMLNTREPGMVQGPALTGGITSTPQTLARFLDLLMTMAKETKGQKKSATVTMAGKTENVQLGKDPLIFEGLGKEISVTTPEWCLIQYDMAREVNLFEAKDKPPLARISFDRTEFETGETANMAIELNADLDATEYFALVCVPSNTSIKQTEDLLADYRGNQLYGQRAQGGELMQVISVPFRGNRVMNLSLEGRFKGSSPAMVLIRHVGDPARMSAQMSGKVSVK